MDVWDIVDTGRKEKKTNGQRKKQEVLDASTIDVYRHTNAVLLLVHPQHVSSLDYARYTHHALRLILILYQRYRTRSA